MDLSTSMTRRLARVVSPTSGTAAKQLYFFVLVLGFTALVAISGPGYVLSPSYLAALAVLLLATVLAYAIRWEKAGTRWVAVVPVLDILAIGLVRDLMRDSATAASLLSFIPVLWLAARLRTRGTVIAALAVSAAISVPSLVRATHLDSIVLAHAVLLPFTVVQIGMLVTGALAVLDGQTRRMTTTLAEREELLETTAAWEQRLENIIDSIDVGIVVVDRDGHDLLNNRAQRRIHALATPPSHDDPDETQLLVRYPGTTAPIPPGQRPVRRAVKLETFSNYVISVGPPGSEGMKLSTSARQIIDHHGNRDGAVVVFSDVTSYIEAERAQQQFVAAVSHELRTPLTSVIGYLELARDDLDLSRETASYLEVAHRNANQLLVIVEDLLQDQVTRASAGDLTLRPHRLSELAERTVESFVLRAEAVGLALEQDLEETPVMPLDAQRLTQAIGNLLSNALKYTPSGGTVRVHSCVVEGAVELNVIDSGVGMSDQEQTNLFTDFYRTEAARRSGIPGHGIGLALTRRIVLGHGGQISVRSTPRTGSTFTIRLPLQPDADTDGSIATRTVQAHVADDEAPDLSAPAGAVPGGSPRHERDGPEH